MAMDLPETCVNFYWNSKIFHDLDKKWEKTNVERKKVLRGRERDRGEGGGKRAKDRLRGRGEREGEGERETKGREGERET